MEAEKVYYIETGERPKESISSRNRRILTLLNVEGRMTPEQLSRRLKFKVKTIIVELKYLERLGLVKEVQ